MTTHTQFKTLVQHELARLEALVNQDTRVSTYPTYHYAHTSRSRTLLSRKQSTYHALFSFITKVKLIMF